MPAPENYYPMRVTAPDGTRVRVVCEEDHSALMAAWARAGDSTVPPREELMIRAGKLGLRVDGRWSGARLLAEIERVEEQPVTETEAGEE